MVPLHFAQCCHWQDIRIGATDYQDRGGRERVELIPQRGQGVLDIEIGQRLR
jgi:hypothetical protein